MNRRSDGPDCETPGVISAAVFPAEGAEVRALFRAYAASLSVDLAFQDFRGELAALPGDYVLPHGGLWLAHRAGAAVGCVALRGLAPGVAELKRLYLRPQARGTGLGRLLLEHALREARQRGHLEVRLDVLPEFHAAIRLYEAMGFRDIPPYCHNPVPGARFLGLRLLPEERSG